MFSLLPIALLSLLAATNVFAEDIGISKLNNDQGQTPCELSGDLTKPCTQSRARDEHEIFGSRPQPSNCTCNVIFFNLWSACLFSNGNDTLPVFDHWRSDCQQKSYNVTAGYIYIKQFDIPEWAFRPVPPNATFDPDVALKDAGPTPTEWTTAQKLASVVVGLCSAIALFIIFYITRKWKLFSRGWSKVRQARVPLARYRVRSVHKANPDGFFIDHPLDEEFEDVGYPSNHGHNGYHLSLPLPSLPQRYRSPSAGPIWSTPGKSLWKKLSIKDRLRAIPSIPRPWKRGPVPVRSFPASRGFRLDGGSSITRSAQSERSSNKFPFSHSPSKLRGETIFEDLGDHYSDSGSDRGYRHEQERVSLVSAPKPPPSGILIISSNGDDFTVESGDTPGGAVVRVIPPSPTASQRAAPQRQRSHRNIPPAPLGPAPQPPVIPRSTPTASTHANSIPSTRSRPRSQTEASLHSSAQRSTESLRRNNAHVRRISAEFTPHHLPNHPPANHYHPTPDIASSQYSALSVSREHLISPPPRSRNGSHPSTSESASRTHPLVPHRRGSSAGDAAPQFQNPFQSTTNGSHSRNMSDSVVPLRSDPVMLFPGSVRGAGYSLQPTDSATDRQPRYPPGVFTHTIHHDP